MQGAIGEEGNTLLTVLAKFEIHLHRTFLMQNDDYFHFHKISARAISSTAPRAQDLIIEDVRDERRTRMPPSPLLGNSNFEPSFFPQLQCHASFELALTFPLTFRLSFARELSTAVEL